MPNCWAGRALFLPLLSFFLLRSSNNNTNVHVVVHSLTPPSIQHSQQLRHHRRLRRGIIGRRTPFILQLSSSVEMMEPGGGLIGSSAPEYELQSFQLTAEEQRQQQKQQQQLQYVANDYSDDDEYSNTDSQLLQQQANAVAAAIISHDADVHWSIRSNAFFVTGGLIYLIATSWDWNIYSTPYEAKGVIDDLHNVLNTPQYIFYQLLWIMGPFVYLLNSFIDVKWALLQRQRDAQEKESSSLRRSHLEAILMNSNVSSPSEQPLQSHHHQHSKRKRHLRINAVLKRPKILLRRMRKHIGHRRQLGAATTFGIAAGLSVIAALLGLLVTDGSDSIVSQDSKDMLSIWVGWLESGSIHMYLVSAMLALWRSPWKSSSGSTGTSTDSSTAATTILAANNSASVNNNNNNTPWYSRTESLETLGDIFFGIAAMVDVGLCDSTLDDGIYWWPVVSAVLWLVDALFYLRGDFATLYKE